MMFQIFNPGAFFLLILIPVLIYIGLRTYDKVFGVRKRVMIAMRALVVLLLIADFLALQVWWPDAGQKLCVYYLVDVSTSMEPYRNNIAQTVKQGLEAKPRDTWAGVILFDAKSRVVVPASQNPDINAAVAAIKGDSEGISRSASAEEQETNIQEAIRLAMSSFPSDMARRICLVSDCNETEGNALQEAVTASKAGVDIVAVFPDVKPRADIVVDSIALDPEIHLNEAFKVSVSVTSSIGEQDAQGKTITVQLFRNHVQAASKTIEIKRGKQNVEFRQRLSQGGRFLYEARLDTDVPQNPDNDRVYAYLELKDLPRVLIVANDPAEQDILGKFFKDARLITDVRPVVGLPKTMLDLQEFAAVVIGNIPASEMTANQMKLMHDYVKEFGGNVIMTGGDHSLSAGGYAGTSVEEMLPAFLSFEEKETPTSAMVLVLDTSASMRIHNYDFDGKKPEFLAKFQKKAVDTLTDRDRFGVLLFSRAEIANPPWLVPLQQVVDRPGMQRFNSSFEDRSNLFRPLMAAFQRLEKVNATNRHIILVTDGYVLPSPYDYSFLAMQFAASEVTVSCIAIGGDANQELLRRIARWGNGRYYQAEDMADVEFVLEREIEEFARSVVIERPVESLVLKENEIFNAVDVDIAPMLFGYVRVKPKLAAETLMITRKSQDPLLVTWRYGAGSAAIFTTDVSGKWSQLWITDWEDQFARFWQNLVAWGFKTEPGVDYVPRIDVRGWNLLMKVDALDARNKFVNNLPPAAGLYPLGEKGQLFSEESRIEVALTQVGPGLYQGRHKVDRSGIYLFKVTRKDGTAVAGTGAVVSSNKELAALLPNQLMREKICEMAGGRVVQKPAEIFETGGVSKKRPHDVGMPLLLAACVFFLFDVLVRRWPAVTEIFRAGRKA